MKMVSFQSSIRCFFVPLSYLSFFMIYDLTYSTVIFYEGGQFSTGFMCAIELSFFFMMSDVMYSTVICYEACKFPVIYTLVSCVLLSYLPYDL